jgi:hypothetical protein
MPVILALRSLRQEDQEFQASLGYMVRLCLKKKKKDKRNKPMNMLWVFEKGSRNDERRLSTVCCCITKVAFVT